MRNTRRGSFVGGGYEFAPGANEVSDEALAKAKADPGVASWFAVGILVLDEPAPAEAPVLSPIPVLSTDKPRRRGK